MDCPCVLGPATKRHRPRRSCRSRAKYDLARHTHPAPRHLLLGDDLLLDSGINGGRNDFLLHQLVLALVGPVLDDVCRADVADSFQGAQLLLACRIDIEELRGGRFFSWLRLVSLGRWRRTGVVRNSWLNRLRETGRRKSGTRA